MSFATQLQGETQRSRAAWDDYVTKVLMTIKSTCQQQAQRGLNYAQVNVIPRHRSNDEEWIGSGVTGAMNKKEYIIQDFRRGNRTYMTQANRKIPQTVCHW